jgi:hypothetical protein
MTETAYDNAAAAADSAAAAAARARRALIACVLVLACAVAVLAIDHGTKRQLLDEAKRVRDALDEAGAAVLAITAANAGKEAAGDGTTAAGEDRSGASPSVNGGDPVGPDTRARKAPAGNAKPGSRAAPGGPRSGRAGARGNG